MATFGYERSTRRGAVSGIRHDDYRRMAVAPTPLVVESNADVSQLLQIVELAATGEAR